MQRWTGRIGCAVAVVVAVLAVHRSWAETAAPARDYWQARAVGQGVALGVRENVYSPRGREALARALVDPAVERLSRPGVGFDPVARRADGAMTEEDVAAFDAIFTNYRQYGVYVVDTAATPFLLALHAASTGKYEVDRRVFAAFAIVAFLYGVATFVCLAGHPPLVAAGVAALAAIVWRPFVSDLRDGNVGSLQLAVLAVAAWALSRQAHVAAGALLGIGAAAKPTTALVIATVLLSLASDRKGAGRFVAGVAAGAFAAAIVGAVALGGPHVWIDWVHVLPSLLDPTWGFEGGNVAISKIMPAEWVGVASVAWLIHAAFAAVAVATLKTPAEGAPRDRALLAVAIGAPLMLLTSRLVWFHYYVLLLPLAIVLVRRGAVQERKDVLRVGVVAVAVLAGTNVSPMIFEGGAARAAALFAGTLALCVLGVVDFARLGASPARPALCLPSASRARVAERRRWFRAR
jgi:hypothetical protein